MKENAIFLAASFCLTATLAGYCQPVITTELQDQTNYVGTTATFTVVAAGAEPVSYQWQKFSTGFANLADRTNAVLILSNVQTNDAADYRVVVTDATGTTNSAAAHLSVALPQTLFISHMATGLVALSWQGSMVSVQSGLLQKGQWSGYSNVPAWGRSLDCPVWVRVAGPSPVTLPIGTDSQFFKLVALPSAAELQAVIGTNIEPCQSGDVTACEACVAAYFLTEPIATLRLNLEMELMAGYGKEMGSCISAAQSQVLVVVRRSVEGP